MRRLFLPLLLTLSCWISLGANLSSRSKRDLLPPKTLDQLKKRCEDNQLEFRKEGPQGPYCIDTDYDILYFENWQSYIECYDKCRESDDYAPSCEYQCPYDNHKKRKRSATESCCPNGAKECIRCNKRSIEETSEKGEDTCISDCQKKGFSWEVCTRKCPRKRSAEESWPILKKDWCWLQGLVYNYATDKCTTIEEANEERTKTCISDCQMRGYTWAKCSKSCPKHKREIEAYRRLCHEECYNKISKGGSTDCFQMKGCMIASKRSTEENEPYVITLKRRCEKSGGVFNETTYECEKRAVRSVEEQWDNCMEQCRYITDEECRSYCDGFGRIGFKRSIEELARIGEVSPRRMTEKVPRNNLTDFKTECLKKCLKNPHTDALETLTSDRSKTSRESTRTNRKIDDYTFDKRRP